MSASQDDALHIPIEIKTDDLKELQQIISGIEKAEQDIREIKPRKGRGKGDTTSRSPFESPFEEDDEFGILGERRGGGALPSKGKDRTSKAAFDRKSEFATMQENLKEVQANQFNMNSALGVTTQATGFAQLIGRGGGLTGIVSGIAQKAFLPLAIITTITTSVKSAIDALIAPGGPFDRRFKRVIKNEVVSTLSRAKKAEIAQQLNIIRVSTKAGVRGESATIAGDRFALGNPIYDSNLESRVKGLL